MLRRLIFICGCVLIWSGCGSGSFLGNRFDNFTAFYNTFYNARNSFETGYENLHHKDDPVDRNLYLPLFVRPSGNTGNREFDNSITKSADLLRNHPESKWVDDALLLIGKSYFFQEAFVGALQKFREVIDLHTDLENEARFWLARTLIISGFLEDALSELQESLVREDVPSEWTALFQLALGELYVKQSEWELTAIALGSGLEEAKDKETAARAQYLLGQVYETMKRYPEAAGAYRDVKNYNPLYELSYASLYSSVRVEGLYGQQDQALKDLRKMERDDKNFGYRNELIFLKGLILKASGDADAAFNIYDELLYNDNPTSNISALRGRIHYAFGELYRDLDRDYVMASVHFDTAATSLRRPVTSRTSAGIVQYAPEAITDIDELKQNFNSFARVFEQVSRMDSLLWLGRMDQEEFDEKVLEVRRIRAREEEEQRRLLEERQLQAQFRQGANAGDPFQNRNLPATKYNPPNAPNVYTQQQQQAGFLFHRNPVQVQEGQTNFLMRWGDRPLVKNWRRFDAIIGAEEEEELEEGAAEGEDFGSVEESLPEVDTSVVPRDSTSQALMESTRALARYELGNTLFLAMSEPDSAIVWYRMVIEENETESVAQRAYYALAEVHRALGDTLSAESIDDRILRDYADSDFAARIRMQAGGEVEAAIPDSLDLAEIAYRVVYDKWKSGDRDGLLDEMLLLAAEYPTYDIQARALLATGIIHMEEAGTDTTMLLGALPISIPDSVVASMWPDKFEIPESEIDEVLSDSPDKEFTSAAADSLASGSDDVPADSLAQGLVPASADSLASGSDDVPVDSLAQAIVTATTDSMFAESGAITVDSLAQGLAPASADSLLESTETPINVLDPELLTEMRTVYIENVFEKVESDFGGTPFAERAKSLLGVIADIRISLEEALAPGDSLNLALDSESTDADSTGLALDSLSVHPDSLDAQTSSGLAGLDRLTAVGDPVDSTRGLILDPAEAFRRARADSAVSRIEADSTARTATIPSPSVPGDPVQMVPDTTLTPESPEGVADDPPEDGLDVIESSVLKPILSSGAFDEAAVGWSVILEEVMDLDEARDTAAQYGELSEAIGAEVLIFSDITGEQTGYLVCWGLFPDRATAFGEILDAPPGMPELDAYLHLLPLERE